MLMFSIKNVEMRLVMLRIVAINHLDNNTIKSAKFGHFVRLLNYLIISYMI